MSEEPTTKPLLPPERSWLADHIGRLAGFILGGIAVGFLAFLAAIGFSPALGALVVLVAGVAMIAVGGAVARPLVPTYRDEAIALRTIRLGEADRIVTFLTPEHGKVRAVAKGVRKTKSRIGSRVEPVSHVALLCWRGRELDVVSQAETLDAFRQVRENLPLLGTVIAMLEVVDQVAQEHQAAPELFALLLGALRTLERTASPVVLGAFCFKLLALEGVGPVTAACVSCGSPGPLVAFDAGEGGFLCSVCRKGQAVSPEVVVLVHQVLTGGLARALDGAAPEIVPAFERLATSAVEHHLDRRLRATRQLYGSREHDAHPRVSSPDDEPSPAGRRTSDEP